MPGKVGRPAIANKKEEDKALLAKESELHLQMKSHFKLLGPQRTYKAVAMAYGVSPDTVEHAAKTFNWLEEARKYDVENSDPFIVEYKDTIDGFRINALRVACRHLENEMLRVGMEDATLPIEVQTMLASGDIEGSAKELHKFITGLPMRAKDYGDLSKLVDLVKKIVFDWDSKLKPAPVGSGGLRIGEGGKNIITIRYD